jgi:hypothetical protein
MTFNWTWVHIQAGTTTVVQPQAPGVVNPGEGVEFRADIHWSPPFGTVRTNHLNITGTVEALAKAVIDFEASPGHGGSFHNVVRSPGIGMPPPIEPDRIRGVMIGQLPIGPNPMLNTSNPLINAIRIRWTPSDYAPRIVTFTPTASDVEPIFGELYLDFGDPLGSRTIYRIENANFHAGAAIQVPVVPGPAGAALLGLGACVLARRRRSNRLAI